MRKAPLAAAVVAGCLLVQPGAPQAAVGPRAVLLDGEGPWHDTSWRDSAGAMRGMLEDAGYRVRICSPADAGALTALTPDVLAAAPSLERLPVEAAKAITAHVAAGGSLLATGGEPFRELLHRGPDGQWAGTEQMLLARRRRVIVDPAELMQRSTPPPEILAKTVLPGPGGRGSALEMKVLKPVRLGPLVKTFDQTPFRAAEETTIITARGTPGEYLAIEWRDTAGVSWLARVPLGAEWQTHALQPSAFSVARSNSRNAGSVARFDPRSARVLSLSLVQEVNTPPIAPVEFAVGPVEAGESAEADDFTPPVLETISPWYKQYEEIRQGERVRVPIARQRGLTAAAEAEGRYEAIGNLLDPAASRYLAANGASLFWLPSPNLAGTVRVELVQRLHEAAGRVGLLDGGAAEFAFFSGETVGLGARVLNASPSPVRAEVAWTIRSRGSQTVRQSIAVEIGAGEKRDVTATLPSVSSTGEYEVETQLSAGESVCDRIKGVFRVVDRPGARTAAKRLQVENGHFTYNGRRVFLNGVNYWPRSASGLEPSRYFDHWLTPRNYDPEVVEADLSILERLGFNFVSIQYMRAEQGRPLADFLERCRKHGIWAHISTNSASNLRLNPERDRALVEAAGLANNAAVFGYELALEPHMGLHAVRQPYDESWRAWVVEQYGSVEEAERDWGIRGPRNDQGELTNPLDEQLENDGPHRVMVAAYRRFADDLVSRTYGKAVRHLRDLDPGALFAVRTGWGGTGQFGNNRQMGYDLAAGAAHLDAICPEAYGMPAEFPEARRTGFITVYGLYAGNGKPVCWLEFGASVGADGTARARRNQALLNETMMRVAEDSGAEGTVVWWYPGGWRVNERSDFGIMDPDGTPRESARAISDWGRKLQSEAPNTGGEVVTIRIDRDADARGLYGMWEKAGPEYVRAREANRPVRLTTAGSGTNTATMPLVQVGNVPYTGRGPLKYANAEIARVRIEWAGGGKTVENGAQADLPAPGEYRLTVFLVNTGEAAWLPAAGADKEGDCVLRTSAGGLPVSLEVPRFGTTATGPLTIAVPEGGAQLTGRMTALGRGSFGETLRISLRPTGH